MRAVGEQSDERDSVVDERDLLTIADYEARAREVLPAGREREMRFDFTRDTEHRTMSQGRARRAPRLPGPRNRL